MKKLIETRTAGKPRLLFFYAVFSVLGVILVVGLAYRQLFQTQRYSDKERLQSLRRVIVPGPRGNIFDREGRTLVGNRPRFSVVLGLAELRGEFRDEYKAVKANYAKLPADERPTTDQMERIARASVAQRYLDQINFILKRNETVRGSDLSRHINQRLLLPYVLLNDLTPTEYAKLIERLPVDSPLQVYTSSTRDYPHGSLAAHTLGYIGVVNNPDVEDFEGEDLLTFKMKGSFGRDGLERVFDEQLQGETGGAIYLVDPAGFKVKTDDLPHRLPVQGHNLTTSLDLDLQEAAEKTMKGRTGAAVALDVRTGEVLVLASMPEFDLNSRLPILPEGTDLEKSGVWVNRAVQGQYPPGSTFKIITATAALRSGAMEVADAHVVCPGYLQVGNRKFPCDGIHGDVDLVKAITVSCNTFFFKYGLETGPDLIAAEAHRFGFDHPTGIELPYEFSHPRVASPAWRRDNWKQAGLPNGTWQPGDTANIAIGQGDTLVSPLQVACMIASFARGETETKPTLLHDPHRPTQHTEPIGLAPLDYQTIVKGLALCYSVGTARFAQVEGLSGAAKTGTAQKGRIDLAWMVAFAPLENPQIAIAVVMEGTEPGVSYHGSTYAAPVVHAILQAWKEKHDHPAGTQPMTFKVL